MEINRIAIIGSGIMGSGVAQVSAVAGYDVVLQDINDDALARAKSSIEFSLKKLADKGKIKPAQADAALSNIKFTDDLNQAAENADLVIEAVFENLEIKQELFKKLEKLCRPDAIQRSPTSDRYETGTGRLCP